MDSKDDRMPAPSGFPMQYVPSYHSGHRSLPPLSAIDPHHALPTYPSSTLQFYYPSSPSQQVALYSHLPPHFSHPFSSNLTHGGASGLLPSVSRSHVPSLHHTPSSSPIQNFDKINDFSAPHTPHLGTQLLDPSPNSLRSVAPSDKISPVSPRFDTCFDNPYPNPPSGIPDRHVNVNHPRISQHLNQFLYNHPPFFLIPYLLFLHNLFQVLLLLYHLLIIIPIPLLLLSPCCLLRRMFLFFLASMIGGPGTLRYAH